MAHPNPKQDARGQFAKSQADRKNNGLASATPRDVTHHDDATLEHADRKPNPNPGVDVSEQKNKRN